MVLEKNLMEITKIKGYLATGIMQYTGELLVSRSTYDQVDLGMVGATFNDIFRSAHEVCGKIGLEAARELILHTPKDIVVMLCSGVDAAAHFHMMTILSKDGNQALANMQMVTAAPTFTKELS